jgi:glycosyltransferase involved in cell wall biosynthesis
VSGRLPTATVVVPAYNAERTIDECVRSLLDLRYPEGALELIVVDNGSSDATAGRLRTYGDRVRVMQASRRGPSAARNAGLRGAEGEVVAFTDADCRVEPDWLARLAEPLERDEVAIAGGRILARRPANDVELFGEVIHDHRQAIEVFDPPYAITMSWASRRATLRELGGFDESVRRGEDVDLSYRAIQAGYQIAFVESAVVYHRNESSLAGLFREGFLHGVGGVRTRKRHERFLHELGHRGGVNGRAYAEIGRRALDWARGRDAERARCETAFNSGKRAGQLLGSLRFRHLDL